MLESTPHTRNKILAHRGLWNEDVLPNSAQALTNAWEQGFGVETDLRDFQGQIVISHDPAQGNELYLGALLEKLNRIPVKFKGQDLIFAANVKADGI